MAVQAMLDTLKGNTTWVDLYYDRIARWREEGTLQENSSSWEQFQGRAAHAEALHTVH
jgi:hypothetical protein